MDSIATIRLTETDKQPWLKSFFTRRWMRRHSAFVRSCRVIVDMGGRRERLRLIYCSLEKDYATAEQNAEAQIGKFLAQQRLIGEVVELRWKRGRIVTAQTLATETESVHTAIGHVRSDNIQSIIAIEKVEDAAPDCLARNSD